MAFARRFFLAALLATLLVATGTTLAPPSLPALGAGGPPGWSQQYASDAVVLKAVSAVDGMTCWAVGAVPGSPYNSLILKTEDGGATWSAQGPSWPVQLNAVSAVDAATCWVGGDGGIAKTEDGGGSWTVQIYAEGYQVLSLSAVDAATCWGAGGGLTGGFIVKTYDGSNWAVQKSGLPYPVRSVSAADAANCWAAGGAFTGGGLYNIYGNTYGNIWKTNDGGFSWAPVGSESCAYCDVSALDGESAWALGWTTYAFMPVSVTYPESWRTLSGGAGWEVKASPLFPSQVAGIHMLDADSAWLAGRGGYWVGAPLPMQGSIYRSDDGGSTWVMQDADAGFSQADISAVDATTAWAAGTAPLYGSPSAVRGVIMHTTNGGWQAPPTLHSISPTEGIMGDVVTIHGEGFGTRMPTSRVCFGSAEAELVSWSGTEVKCKVPDDLPAGEIGVTVSNNGGASNPLHFNVKYATVIKGRIGGPSGANPAGIEVEVYDLNGDVLASGQSGDQGAFRLVTELPSGDYKLGFWDPADVYAPEWFRDKPDLASADLLSVTGGKLNDVGGIQLAYYPAMLSSITPDTAPAGTVLDAVITGTHLREGAEISLEGKWASVNATEVVVESPERITCRFDLTGIPDYLAGPYDLRIRYLDGGEGSVLDGCFSLVSTQPLGVTSIVPDHGAQYTVVNVTDLACSGFWGDFSVRLEGGAGHTIAAADVSIASPTSLTCTFDINDAPCGAYDVVLANPDGSEARLAGGFAVTPAEPLQLNSITPNYAYLDTAVEADLDCRGFRPGAAVRLEGNGVVIAGTEVTFSYEPPGITCLLDLTGAAVGFYDVVVENPGGEHAVLVDGFEVREYRPIRPDQASQFAMQVDLTIEVGPEVAGQPSIQVRLEKGASVINAYNVCAVSEDAIGCSIFLFGADPGAYDVVVDHPGGTRFFSAAFTVTSPCGQGSGSALLILGVTLGLLSLAGSGMLRRLLRRPRPSR